MEINLKVIDCLKKLLNNWVFVISDKERPRKSLEEIQKEKMADEEKSRTVSLPEVREPSDDETPESANKPPK